MPDRIAQLKAMLESDPNDTFCLYGLGMEYARLGQHQQAMAWFDRAIDADPSYSYAYFHKAKSQEAAGDLAGAQTTLRDGLEMAKGLGDAKAASEIGALLDDYIQPPDEEGPSVAEGIERPT